MRTSHANRGSQLEELILYANMQYQNKGLARIDKFPTPIDPEKVTRNGKVYGHYAKKSTVDYIGTVRAGTIICFDCKETAEKNRLPLANIHPHQIEYMKNIYELGGYAFLIVSFTQLKKYYRLTFLDLYEYWQIYEKTAGMKRRPPGAAAIPLEAFTNEIVPEKGFCLHYLVGIVD